MLKIKCEIWKFGLLDMLKFAKMTGFSYENGFSLRMNKRIQMVYIGGYEKIQRPQCTLSPNFH